MFPLNMGLSCNFSLKPIHSFKLHLTNQNMDIRYFTIILSYQEKTRKLNWNVVWFCLKMLLRGILSGASKPRFPYIEAPGSPGRFRWSAHWASHRSRTGRALGRTPQIDLNDLHQGGDFWDKSESPWKSHDFPIFSIEDSHFPIFSMEKLARNEGSSSMFLPFFIKPAVLQACGSVLSWIDDLLTSTWPSQVVPRVQPPQRSRKTHEKWPIEIDGLPINSMVIF